MVLITNRSDIKDAHKLSELNDRVALLSIKKELQLSNTNTVYYDDTIMPTDEAILKKFFESLGVDTFKI